MMMKRQYTSPLTIEVRVSAESHLLEGSFTESVFYDDNPIDDNSGFTQEGRMPLLDGE